MALQFTSPQGKIEIGMDGLLSGGKVLPGLSIPMKQILIDPKTSKNGRTRNGR